MYAKSCSLVIGSLFAFFGICGLIPRLVWHPADHLPFEQIWASSLNGYVFGWLPSNICHAILYLVLGGAGILAAATFFTSKAYLKAVMAITILLILAGFAPLDINTVFGLMPLYGFNIMLHTVIAVLAYYYGFIYPLDMGVGTEPIPQ